MPLNTAKLDDFSGGINAVDDPTDFEANELAYGPTVDVEFIGHGKGMASRRLHTLEYSSLIAPAGMTNWIASMAPIRATTSNTDSLIMSSYGGRIDVYSPAAGTLVNRLAAAGGTDKLWYFEQMADSTNVQKCYMVNGVSTPQSYNIDTPAATVNWAGSPPNGTVLKVWKNMMCVAGVATQPQRLYYSAIANPESFPTNNFIDIKSSDDENDKIVGLEVIGESLLVFKQASVWLVFDPVSFDNRRIASYGLANAWAKCVLNDRVYFCTNDGVYSTDGDTVKNESLNLQCPGGPFDNNGFTTARMAATPDGRVTVAFGTGFNYGWWLLETRIRRPDGQGAWLFHQSTVRYSSTICTATVGTASIPKTLLFFVHNDLTTNQWLYRAWQKTSGTADDSQSLFGAGFAVRRMALQGTENFERLRRINLLAKANPSYPQLQLSILDESGVSVYNGSPTCPTTYTGFARVRPEIRMRFFQPWVVMYGYGAKVVEMEFKYRGGKEH